LTDARFRSAADTLDQDWDAIAAWVATAGKRLDRDVEPRQFAGGLANLNYLISVDGAQVVLRRPPAGALAEGANDMAREARVLGSLAPHYPLAPHLVGFCEDLGVIGVQFQLIEYRAGDGVRAELPPELAGRPGVGTTLTDLLVEGMAGLHALDPQEVGLGDLGKPEGFLARQVEGWARRGEAAYDGDPPKAVDLVVRWLRRELPEESGVSLVHCDLKFDNMLFDFDALRPVAVVDWDMCTRGDPLFDLAVLASYWIEAGDPDGVQGLNQVPSLEPGFPRRAELIERYFTAAGREPVDLSFHIALARLRLAIAWQQLYQRWERGALVGDRYPALHDQANAILDWTADTLT
jgi:aminoglycoside phosphotransferase (APT) family kinase protein